MAVKIQVKQGLLGCDAALQEIYLYEHPLYH
jgi:hypothetical protein